MRRALLASVLLSGVSLAQADEPLSGVGHRTPRGEAAEEITAQQPVPAAHVSASHEWVVAPIPTYDPSQRLGLQLVAQYIFGSHAAADSSVVPPSVVALGGFYTQEDSRGLFLGYRGHLAEDRWRASAAAGAVRINFDFYGIGNELADLDVAVPITQMVEFGMVQLMRRTWRQLYAGVRLVDSSVEVSTNGVDATSISLPPLDRAFDTKGAGVVLQWDTRDNQFYPTRGMYINATALYSSGDFDYETYQLHWNLYRPLQPARTVLALRASIDAVGGGDAPFYALPQFGQHNDLRGYKTGKYRDRTLVALQAEYRRSFGERWGAVAFAGVGEVEPSLGELTFDDALASGGLGLRFRLGKANPVNFRLDWAYGNDGNAVYLSVGEAF